mgnify:CR=1 FL=1
MQIAITLGMIKSMNPARSVFSTVRHSLLRVSATSFFVGLVLLAPALARAGFVEIGASGSYKKSNIGTNSFDESQWITGSFSYYFDESSALELSYTDVVNRRMIGEGQADGMLTNMYYKMIGLDLVITLGEKNSTLRPYFKVGGLYIMDKRIITQSWLSSAVYNHRLQEDPPALVPSAGLGFKLSLAQGWSLKVGVDAWSSRSISEQPVLIDYAGRVGLSWMF